MSGRKQILRAAIGLSIFASPLQTGAGLEKIPAPVFASGETLTAPGSVIAVSVSTEVPTTTSTSTTLLRRVGAISTTTTMQQEQVEPAQNVKDIIPEFANNGFIVIAQNQNTTASQTDAILGQEGEGECVIKIGISAANAADLDSKEVVVHTLVAGPEDVIIDPISADLYNNDVTAHLDRSNDPSGIPVTVNDHESVLAGINEVKEVHNKACGDLAIANAILGTN